MEGTGAGVLVVRAVTGMRGWLHMLFATRWHDPVTQQLHDLIEFRMC